MSDPNKIPETKDRETILRHLKEMLSFSEGTDEARIKNTGELDSYNARLGYGNFKGVNWPELNKPITDMTVNEVIQYQKKFINAQNRVGTPSASSALGKYQYVSKTLEDMVKHGKLDPNEKFNATTQERLVEQHLVDLGFDMYMEGKMSFEDFQNKISKTWASVPNSEGVGSYDDQPTKFPTTDFKQILENGTLEGTTANAFINPVKIEPTGPPEPLISPDDKAKQAKVQELESKLESNPKIADQILQQEQQRKPVELSDILMDSFEMPASSTAVNNRIDPNTINRVSPDDINRISPTDVPKINVQQEETKDSPIDNKTHLKFGGFMRNLGVGLLDNAASVVGATDAVDDWYTDDKQGRKFKEVTDVTNQIQKIGGQVAATAIGGPAAGAGLGAVQNAVGSATIDQEEVTDNTRNSAQVLNILNSINSMQAGKVNPGQVMAYGGEKPVKKASNINASLRGIHKDVKKYDGKSHEQGGIQVGNNTEVEGGEVKFKNFIFSNRI